MGRPAADEVATERIDIGLVHCDERLDNIAELPDHVESVAHEMIRRGLEPTLFFEP